MFYLEGLMDIVVVCVYGFMDLTFHTLVRHCPNSAM